MWFPKLGLRLSFQFLSLSIVEAGLLVLPQGVKGKMYLSLEFSMTGERRQEVPGLGVGGAESLPSSGGLSHRKDADESALPGDRTWEATGVVE